MRIKHHPRRTGFTLAELMVVMVLIAVMSALLIPVMKGSFEGERLRSTSRKLIDGMSIASSQSVILNQQHRLVIDREKGRYRVERLVRNREQGGGFQPVTGIPGCEDELDENIKIELIDPQGASSQSRESSPQPFALNPVPSDASGLDRIVFYPDGTTQRMEVQLRDREGFGLSLKLNPVTTRVVVEKLERNSVR